MAELSAPREEATSGTGRDELAPNERAAILVELLKHYSNLRFVMLPLVGAAIGAPLVIATQAPSSPTWPLVALTLGGGFAFLPALWRVQDLIDLASDRLGALVADENSEKWGDALRYITLVAVVSAAFLVSIVIVVVLDGDPAP